jgi:hypothetical protein
MISIHQPNYLPWLGFFDKARRVDTFVLLDNVPYTRNSVCNRNKIKTARGWEWITVPVHHPLGAKIMDIETVDSGWEEAHWKTILFNYSRATYFDELSPMLRDVYAKKWRKLAEVNETLIRLVMKYLGLSARTCRASELRVDGKSTELLVNICKAVGDTEYLSGSGARDYLDLRLLREERVSVRFQQFTPPQYPQRFGEFIPNLSTIDYLFNCGAKTWA